MITTDLQGAVERFTGYNGREILLNVSPDYVLLRDLSKTEMQQLLAESRERLTLWLTWLLYSTDINYGIGRHKGWSATRRDAPQMLWGLWGTVRRRLSDRCRTEFTLDHLQLSGIPSETWDLVRHIPLGPAEHRSMALTRADLDTQRAFLRAAIGDTFTSMVSVLNRGLRHLLDFPDCEQWLEGAPDATAFLLQVVEAVHRAKLPRGQYWKAAGSRLLLYWLCQRQILLAPLNGGFSLRDLRDAWGFFRPSESTDVLALIGQAHDNDHWNYHWKQRLHHALILLTTSSTLRTPEDLNTDLLQRLNDISGAARISKSHFRPQFAAIHEALHTHMGSPESIPPFDTCLYRKPQKDPFAWTKLSTQRASRSRFPGRLKGDYEPKEHIIAWGETFSALFERLNHKCVTRIRAAGTAFLVWMIEKGITARSLQEIRRQDINDYGPRGKSHSFRAWVDQNVGKDIRWSIIQGLRLLFGLIIERDFPGLSNPISADQDLFKQVRRGKTPRAALGPEMMKYLIQLNARNDFEISRRYAPHSRSVYDPETRQRVRVWFPALAILIDLLLKVPMRSFQARFLDSAEGDDCIVDPFSPALPEHKNPSPLRQPGRREGVFYVFEVPERDPVTGHDETHRILGLYLNTNKTGIHREAGYELPWCDEGIRNNLVRMMAWQQRYNPITAPVPCMERVDYAKVKNEAVRAALKMSFPIFRDPDMPGNWPVSRALLAEYWAHLCAVAEDELQRTGRRVRLTEPKVIKNGRVQTWDSEGPCEVDVNAAADTGTADVRVKRWYLFDLHTMRVSGVTALIEAGLPIDFVQQVVGHHTPVMTEYYHKPSPAQLNTAIVRARRALERNAEGLPQMAEPDWDQLAGFLQNQWGAEDTPGLEMLKARLGLGTGSIQVLSHGICPGGECDSGGPAKGQGYSALPRPLACSLCRYRLTGPMFWPGLLLNANRLMYEVLRKAQEIADLQAKIDAGEDKRQEMHALRARRNAVVRETDVLCQEWAAEVRYVRLVEGQLREFLHAYGPAALPADGRSPESGALARLLVTGMEPAEIKARLENHHEFFLLQKLVEGMAIEPGFRLPPVLIDHREFLNEILAANRLDPFLLGLRGDLRDRLANLCGQALVRLVPEDRIDDLRAGRTTLGQYPILADFLQEISQQVRATGGLDLPALKERLAKALGPGATEVPE